MFCHPHYNSLSISWGCQNHPKLALFINCNQPQLTYQTRVYSILCTRRRVKLSQKLISLQIFSVQQIPNRSTRKRKSFVYLELSNFPCETSHGNICFTWKHNSLTSHKFISLIMHRPAVQIKNHMIKILTGVPIQVPICFPI